MPESENRSAFVIVTSSIALVAFGVISWYVFAHATAGESTTQAMSSPATSLPTLKNENLDSSNANSTPQQQTLPPAVLINVPFTPQAPRGIWTEPWGEACEEAAIAMAMAWVNGKTAITPSEAEQTIREEIAYEEATFGYHIDTAIRETAKIITRYFNYPRIDVIYDVTIDDVKRELAAGNIVLIPTAGALLENPYFTGLPPYHMLVAVGYDDEMGMLIVEEPGTRHGENYRYPYATISNSMHDWTGDEATIESGRTGIIVVHPADATHS